MTKRTFAVALGLLALCLPLAAQDTAFISPEQLRATGELETSSALTLNRPDLFTTVDGSVLIHGLPVLTLLDGRRFPINNELGRMGMSALDLVPVAFLRGVEVQKVHASPAAGSEGTGGVVNLQLRRDYVTGGEVGVFYGKSSGKYGREDFQTYVVGTVANDKISITAGAAYTESSGHIPRRGR